jgi:hypothetical protein
MIGEWLLALEAMPVAGALRGSVWAYPLVNAAHILGVAQPPSSTSPIVRPSLTLITRAVTWT